MILKNQRVIVIRVHGRTGLKKGIKDTLSMMRLYKKHNCVVVPNSPSIIGMITKVKDYVTWGELHEDMFLNLLKKRGRLARKQMLTEEYLKEKLHVSLQEFAHKIMSFELELTELPGFKLFFKLSPPKGGFERGGVKKQFAAGGAVGYRKEKINELLQRMI